MWYPKNFVYSERTGPKRLGCRHRGQLCLPRSPQRTPQLFLTSRFFRCFSVALSTRTSLQTVIRRFAALSATFPPRTPQPFLTSRFFPTPFQYTFHYRTVVPTAIRTFVLHPVALLASNPSSKNSAAAPHLRFFRRLFTVFHGTVKSPGLHPSVQLSPGKAAFDNVEKPNSCHRLGSVRCSCHATSTESL